VVVLDRPNPLGLSWQGKADSKWRRVEGNILDTKWHSFVGWYPIPLRCDAFSSYLSPAPWLSIPYGLTGRCDVRVGDVMPGTDSRWASWATCSCGWTT
jgi:hypothetical protein